jgi:uncharacterized integral membrane protein
MSEQDVSGTQGVDPDISTPPPAGKGRGRDPLRGSSAGRAWVAVVALAVVLILLVIFIAQNTRKVTVSFLGLEGQTPLAVALLIAAVAGLLIAAIAGTLRILQLRTRVRREQKRRPAV